MLPYEPKVVVISVGWIRDAPLVFYWGDIMLTGWRSSTGSGWSA